jgi:hypothetical protein
VKQQASPYLVRDALAECELTMGAGWVWNPVRWGTVDGYVDYHTLLATSQRLHQLKAKRRIDTALAFQMALGGESATALIRQTERIARGEAE